MKTRRPHLTPADFEVVERGRRQTVRQVVYVRPLA
jgi:hypothetical protein